MRTDDLDLASRLSTTLRVKAGSVSEGPARFDPTRRPFMAPEPPQTSRRRTLLSVVAAAVVLVVVSVVVTWHAADRKDSGRTATDATTMTTPEPDGPGGPGTPNGALIPTWVPEGLDLWSASWRIARFAGAKAQLFGDPDAGRAILVEIRPADPGSRIGEPTDVRGQDGSLLQSGTTSILFWQEDASIEASFRGMSIDEALAFLEGLRWRSSNHEEGFSPPDDPSFPLRGEADPVTPAIDATFTYSEGVPNTGVVASGQRVLEIHTSTATGEMTANHLRGWFTGTRQQDGVTRSFDGALLDLEWPNGQTVSVNAWGTPSDEATLDQVANAVHPGTAAELDQLQAAATGQVLTLPRVASVELPSGVLEIHGEPDRLNVLCVRLFEGHGEARCGEISADTLMRGNDLAATSTLIDGRWYVGAASSATEPLLTSNGLGQPKPLELVETGSNGSWAFALGPPPSTVDNVVARFGGLDLVLHRPG